jgi:hypothetical protein
MSAHPHHHDADERVSLDRNTTQAQHHVGHEHGGDVLFKALFFTLASRSSK